ncbi:MAG: extracellular electron transfer flavoprotein PplA, partial [Enterococcus viikkiensis]
YRVVFDMTVKDGKITKSNYDYLNEDGKSKQKDAEYEKSMKEKTKTGPKEYIPALNKSLEDTQNPDAVEAVTGATHSSENFKNYSQQLVQAAQAGDTKTIEIDNGAAMKDGTYKLEEKNYSNGYRTIFSMTVAGGKITESNFDMVDKDGKSKKDDADYEKNMKAKSGVGPKEYIEQLNKGLVEKGAPADVEVVTGATHSSHAFQTYAAQLVNAAEKGNTNTIQVDNIVTKK